MLLTCLSSAAPRAPRSGAPAFCSEWAAVGGHIAAGCPRDTYHFIQTAGWAEDSKDRKAADCSAAVHALLARFACVHSCSRVVHPGVVHMRQAGRLGVQLLQEFV